MTQQREIEENAADGIISINDGGCITHFNASAVRIFGYAREEVIGKPLTILLPEHSRPHHDGYMQRFKDAPETARSMGERAPVVGRRKDGVLVPLDISIMRHKAAGERKFTAIIRDITYRVEQERALAAKERKFRAIFDGSYQFVALIGIDGAILELNRSALQLVGGDQSEYAGQLLWRTHFWPNDAEKSSLREAVILAATGNFSHLIVDIQSADGRIAKLDLSIKSIRTNLDTVEFLIAEGRDVTELVDINEALRKSEARLANAQKIARLGNWDADLKTGHSHWSDEFYRILGLSPGTLGASLETYMEFVHPDDRKYTKNTIDNLIRSGEPCAYQHRIICPDRTMKIVHVLAESHRDEAGRTTAISGTMQDITEAWEREQALARARDDAEEANRSKSLFLATMSHELRTPLNAIIGFGEVMSGEMFGALGQPAYKEYSTYILESGQHLLKIINDILDVTRIESGTTEVNIGEFDPLALIHAAVRFVHSKAESKGVKMSVRPPDERYTVSLDERLCKQILINLINNAVKFTEPGGQVDVCFDYDGSKASFTIVDTGIGISREDLSRIFDPFFQSEGAFARKYDGVGLGLTIVKNLVELQKGAVTVKSKQGVGTSVRVDFPADVVVAASESCKLRQLT